MSNVYIGKRAVVIGAGVGGLAAAQALADHFEQVLVFERDRCSTEATPRPGVPQGRHPHGLLSGGLRALGNLFPNFSASLAQAGARGGDFGLDVQLELPGQDALPRRELGIPIFSMTRPLLETTLLRHVGQRSNVSFRGGCRVASLFPSSDGKSVVGVSIERRDGRREIVLTDFVVDASGRAAPTIDLARSTGRPAFDETVVGVNVGYSSAVYSISPDAMPDCKALMTMSAPSGRSRAAVMLAREDGLWFVALQGRGIDLPPSSNDGFLKFAASLETPTLYNAIKGAKRQGKAVQFAFPESRRRRFYGLGFPRGLIPIGDSICRFNPIYGQGMSIAAQQAVMFRDVLTASATKQDPFAVIGKDFISGVEQIIENPWALSVLTDLTYPETDRERPHNLQQALDYQVALHRAAYRDPNIHKLLVEVLSLMKPASLLNAPDVMQTILGKTATARLNALNLSHG
jgi:2-polyprenyl-6-methoxyphenol hydroxylase-like FAD-dependent oxidoreductase